MNLEKYPGVSIRVKAVFTDSIIVVVFMLLITYLFEQFEYVPDYVRILAFSSILLYDPIFYKFLWRNNRAYGIGNKSEK